MIVIPAIDIRNGKVVRLTQGAAGSEKVYSDSPIEVAEKWASYGVEMIHIVDLDGAFGGDFKNLGLIQHIAKSVDADIELGGGLRDEETIRKVFDAGVAKAVLSKFKDKIVAGIDAIDGIVYTKGWVFNTKIRAIDLAVSMEKSGVKRINYTDISRDGMLEGPNLKSLEELLDSVGMHVVASGGISTFEDLQHLKALEQKGLTGVIIGKALYEGTIDLGEAVNIC